MRSINEGVAGAAANGTDGKNGILVPLTSSLYVKGTLADREKVLVDVGTGFYVEKVCYIMLCYAMLCCRCFLVWYGG